MKWVIRIACGVMNLAGLASIAGVALGGRVFRWEAFFWLALLLLTYGWTVPVLARAARRWETSARDWKDLAMGWQKRYEDSNGDMMRLLRADRGEQL